MIERNNGKRLKEIVQQALNAVWPDISKDVFTNVQYAHAALKHLKNRIDQGELNLNDYWPDVFGEAVERDVHKRNRSPFGKRAIQQDLPVWERTDPEKAAEYVICLGDGRRVTYLKSLGTHMMQKIHQETVLISAATESLRDHTELMQSKIGVSMMEDPEKTFEQAMNEHDAWRKPGEGPEESDQPSRPKRPRSPRRPSVPPPTPF